MRIYTYVLCTLFILFNVYIGTAQNEVELLPDGIVVPRMASAPANASSTEGQFFYNTTSDQFEFYNGTSWQPLGGSGGPGFTPYKIEDLVNADTYILTSDNSAAGLGDVISVAVDGVAGLSIDKVPSNEIRLNFTSDRDNIVIGEDSGEALTATSRDNILIGARSGFNTQSGLDNVYIGDASGRDNADGDDNVYIGDNAGLNDSSGDRNVYIGADAGRDNNNTTGSASGNNVFVGYNSGTGSSGTNNTYIGSNTGRDNSGIQNIFLGNGAGANESNLSHRLIIDNNSIGNPLIYGEFDNELVRIGGDLEILPKENSINPVIRMPDASGNMDEVLRKNTTTGDVVFGDVESNGGELGLRANGLTRLSVLADGSIKFWELSSPPGTCNSSRAGHVYFDSGDDKLKVCGRGGITNNFAWYNMH